jgi:hypothetical protein
MKFMMITNATKESEAGLPPDPRMMAAVAELVEDLTKAGILVSTGGLHPSSQGATIRLSGGNITVTDGPFTEAKEIIGGYAILDVKSKEEAVELARRCWQITADIMGPSYEGGGTLLRMWDASDFE